MAANPTHEKKRVSTPGNFDMFFQTKTVTAQVATKAQTIENLQLKIYNWNWCLCVSPRPVPGRDGGG